MKIPAHEDEIPKWLEVCHSMLGDPENHLVKRLVLMAQALTGLGEGDLSRAEYCEEKAALLFDAAAAGDVNADAALCMIASRLLARGKRLPPKLAVYASGILGERGFSPPRRRRGRHAPHATCKSSA